MERIFWSEKNTSVTEKRRELPLFFGTIVSELSLWPAAQPDCAARTAARDEGSRKPPNILKLSMQYTRTNFQCNILEPMIQFNTVQQMIQCYTMQCSSTNDTMLYSTTNDTMLYNPTQYNKRYNVIHMQHSSTNDTMLYSTTNYTMLYNAIQYNQCYTIPCWPLKRGTWRKNQILPSDPFVSRNFHVYYVY